MQTDFRGKENTNPWSRHTVPTTAIICFITTGTQHKQPVISEKSASVSSPQNSKMEIVLGLTIAVFWCIFNLYAP